MKNHSRSLGVIILSVFLILLFNSTIFAQNKGYIVTTQNEKIDGEFLSTKITNVASFKSNTENNYKQYAPKEIAYLWVNNAKYESIDIEVENGKALVFGEVLVEGKVNLYKVKDVFYLKKDNQFIKIEREFKTVNGVQVEHKKYINTLKKHFYDDKAILPKIDQVDYTKRSLKKIVNQYLTNKWPNESVYIAKSNKISIKKYAGIGFGNYTVSYMRTPMNVASVSKTIGSYYTIGAGFILEYNWRVSTEIGVFYSKRKSELHANYSFGKRRFFFDHNYIDVPILINFNILPKKISPRFSLGTNLSFPLNREVPGIEDVTNNMLPSELDGILLEIIAGVGIIKKNNPKRIFLDYFFRFGLSQTNGFAVRELQSISHSLRIGYAF